MLPDDSEDRRQTKTSAFACRFGRKKWFEDTGENLRIHPDAVVAESQTDESSFPLFRIGRNGATAYRFQRGIDGNAPAVGHGIPSVHRQIHCHLLKHAVIGMDRRERGVRAEFELDMFADQSLKHFDGVPQSVVKIQMPELHDLLAAE